MDRPSLSWKAYFQHPSSWFAIIFALLVAVLPAIAVNEWQDANLLDREAQVTTGRVTDHEITTSRRSNGSSRRNYSITISYSDARGVGYSSRFSVSSSEYEMIRVGSSVPVRYAPSDPLVVEYDFGSTRRGAWAAGLIGLGGAIGLVISGVMLVRVTSAQRRAARDGERRVARVTAHHQAGKKLSKKFQAEWTDGSQTRRTRSRPQNELPPVGTDIAVFIDPVTGTGWWEADY